MSMRNITLSAEDRLLAAAQAKARREHTTLNAEFRRWLEGYVSRKERVEAYRRMMAEMHTVSSGNRRYTRDELNAR